MLVLLAATVLLSFACKSANAISVPMQDATGLFKGNRVVEIDGGQKASGAEALRAAYAKYNWTVPDDVEQVPARARIAAEAIQTGSVTATNLPNDRAYLANVKVGAQTLLLNMDSGSSDLWVVSSAMPKSQRGTHKLYQLEGALAQGETWDIEYLEGSGASGNVYADKVVIGGVTATVQAVEAATSVSSSFTTGAQDGIVGLGFGIGNTCTPRVCNTFMQQVATTLPKVIFTAFLRHNAPGEYDFGFIDSTKFSGKLTYNSLTGRLGGSFWEFTVGGFSVGSGNEVSRSMTFIADTGTSLLLTDDAVVKAFYAPVSQAAYSRAYGGWVLPCAQANKLISLSFYINGVKHTMPGSYGIYLKIGDAENTCYGGVQSNSGAGYTIMGDVFLKSQFVVFDVHTPRIGFAQQAGVKV